MLKRRLRYLDITCRFKVVVSFSSLCLVIDIHLVEGSDSNLLLSLVINVAALSGLNSHQLDNVVGLILEVNRAAVAACE